MVSMPLKFVFSKEWCCKCVNVNHYFSFCYYREKCQCLRPFFIKKTISLKCDGRHWIRNGIENALTPNTFFFLAILPNKSNVDDLATKISQMYDIAINFCNIPHFPTNKRNIVWRKKYQKRPSNMYFTPSFFCERL